jgi:DNA replication protein DnaC
MSNYHQLLNQLEELNLKSIKENLPNYLDEIAQSDQSFVESLFELTTQELFARKVRQKQQTLQRAMFPYHKKVSDFDFDFQPKIKKKEILDLMTLRFLDTHENLLFIGNSGVGKTHLAVSVGMACVERGISCLFITSTELVNRLSRAHKRGTSATALKKYAGYSVLIIDEIGYLPFSREGSNLLFQLINLRYEKKSTIVTTNIPLSQWAEIFGNKKLTNALLDRLIHHSKIIQITGPSYRMKSYSEQKTTK